MVSMDYAEKDWANELVRSSSHCCLGGVICGPSATLPWNARRHSTFGGVGALLVWLKKGLAKNAEGRNQQL